MPHRINPNKNPTVVAIAMPMNSFTTPMHFNFPSLITVPKMAAIIGPIRGEINILAAKNRVLFSTNPKAASIPATIRSITKSNVIAASPATSCTI